MSTLNQERAARKVKEVIEKNLDIDGGKLLKSVDYGIGFQRSPGRVFKSKGFRKALKKLGFSIEAADMVVAKILRTGKEENQLKASDQVYKRLGGYQQEPDGGNKTQINILFIDKTLAKRYGFKDSDKRTD